PKMPRRRRAWAAASAMRPSATARATSPSRAQPERQCSPSAWVASCSSVTDGARRAPEWAGGGGGRRVGVAGGGWDGGVGGGAAGAGGEGDLAAGDRPQAAVTCGVGELERPGEAVVVGQRERRVAELGGAEGELVGLRGAVEEREAGVGVQLDHARCAYQRPW